MKIKKLSLTLGIANKYDQLKNITNKPLRINNKN